MEYRIKTPINVFTLQSHWEQIQSVIRPNDCLILYLKEAECQSAALALLLQIIEKAQPIHCRLQFELPANLIALAELSYIQPLLNQYGQDCHHRRPTDSG